jgi:RNA polymerase sigma factor (sigma-70 family)
MTEPRLGLVVHQLRRIAAADTSADAPDNDLLDRFARHRDEAAFTALLRRHGPMVLGLCRRLANNAADADDLFQATFLLLARKAAAIRKRESVASWLHGVAYRLAGKLRRQNARRQVSERRGATMRTAQPALDAAWHELHELLANALQRLPERYRSALVLCYLEGLTHEEAARRLGCPLATLRSRVARGRELLRRRLTHGGLTLAAAPFAALLAAQHADAVPCVLLDSTRTAVLQIAAGEPATELVSDSVLMLVRGGVRPVKLLGAVLLGIGLAVAGAGLVAHHVPAADPSSAPAAESVPQAAAAPDTPRLDRHGDPLPPEALTRLGTVRFRQGGDLRSIAFTPDGKVLVSCAGDANGSAVRLSDPATGKVLRDLHGKGEDSFACMALTADGKRVVAGGSAWDRNGKRVGVIYVWDLATGKELGRIEGRYPDEWIVCLAITPNGRTLATGSEVFFHRERPQVIRLWDLDSGRELRALQGHDGPISALVFTPDGKTLISASSSRWKTVKDHTIRLWDVATGRERRRLEGHQQSVRALTLSADGRTLASGSWDGTVRLWDLSEGKETGRLIGHSGGVYCLTFAPDGKRLATASGYDDVSLHLWDLTTRRPLHAPVRQPRPIEGLAFSPDGKLLATAGGEGHTIRLWDPAHGKDISPAAGHQADVSQVYSTTDGRVLTWSLDEQTLREWDPSTGQERRRFQVPRWVFCAAVSADGRLLAYAREDKIIRLCDWTMGKEVGHCKGHTDHLRGLAFSPDGKLLASGGDDKTVRLWDVAPLTLPSPPVVGGEGRVRGIKELRRFTHEDYFHAILFAPDGKSLVWTGINNCMRVWDVATGAERLRSDRVGQSIDGLAISPDGKLLAKGRPGFVELWDLTTGKEVGSLRGRRPHEGISISNRCSLAFSPDGKTLAVAGWDDHVRLYELATGRERHRLVGHPGRVTSVAFSADGRTLVTGSADTTALLWDLTGKTVAPIQWTESEQQGLWDDLATADSERAYRAMQTLMADLRRGVAFLRTHVRPVPTPDPQRLARLLTDLDSEQFAVREKAAAGLADMGEAAEPALRERLGDKPSLETRRRLEQLLERLRGAARHRQSRAIEILERVGDRDARLLLEEIARGLSSARLTEEAQSALRRLAAHTANR